MGQCVYVFIWWWVGWVVQMQFIGINVFWGMYVDEVFDDYWYWYQIDWYGNFWLGMQLVLLIVCFCYCIGIYVVVFGFLWGIDYYYVIFFGLCGYCVVLEILQCFDVLRVGGIGKIGCKIVDFC